MLHRLVLLPLTSPLLPPTVPTPAPTYYYSSLSDSLPHFSFLHPPTVVSTCEHIARIISVSSYFSFSLLFFCVGLAFFVCPLSGVNDDVALHYLPNAQWTAGTVRCDTDYYCDCYHSCYSNELESQPISRAHYRISLTLAHKFDRFSLLRPLTP